MTDELKPSPQDGEDEFSFRFNAALVEWELKRGCDLVLREPCGDEWVIPSGEGALDVWNARAEPSVQEAARIFASHLDRSPQLCGAVQFFAEKYGILYAMRVLAEKDTPNDR